jgi:hypothetical protein
MKKKIEFTSYRKSVYKCTLVLILGLCGYFHNLYCKLSTSRTRNPFLGAYI